MHRTRRSALATEACELCRHIRSAPGPLTGRSAGGTECLEMKTSGRAAPHLVRTQNLNAICWMLNDLIERAKGLLVYGKIRLSQGHR
jgi:hypothetical protein